ncbi:MAG: histidinol phosphate phosphatase domain-containing protein [Candidatus Omnitrophica bacterium]|nr:histidinol phosphate phosphatase domain-containing protein [Candidatus Omnitrophota bacterium]
MIDFHTHTFFTDGALSPSELVQRAIVKGYEGLAITDHVDSSNIDFIVPRIVKAAKKLSLLTDITVIPGVEITHVPLKEFKELITYARKHGARIVLAHGETLVEPVIPGTNYAALNNDIDILAHPGLITLEEAKLAAKRGIYLEITTRRGHCYTNGHVVRMARQAKAKLLLNNDAHEPDDLVSEEMAEKIARGAGMSSYEVEALKKEARSLLKRLRRGR